MRATDLPVRTVVTLLTELPYLIMVYSTAVSPGLYQSGAYVFVNNIWEEAVVAQLRHNSSIQLDSPGQGGTRIGSYITQAGSRKILYEEFNKLPSRNITMVTKNSAMVQAPHRQV
jgi:hypothetical protein